MLRRLGTFADLNYGTAPLSIGAGNYDSDPNGVGTFRRNFDGFIDEVRISSAALAPGQFLNAPVVVPEPGTFAPIGLVGMPLAAELARRRK